MSQVTWGVTNCVERFLPSVIKYFFFSFAVAERLNVLVCQNLVITVFINVLLIHTARWGSNLYWSLGPQTTGH
jgi:hypothetical protein